MLSSSTLLSSRVKIGLVALIMLACFIKGKKLRNLKAKKRKLAIFERTFLSISSRKPQEIDKNEVASDRGNRYHQFKLIPRLIELVARFNWIKTPNFPRISPLIPSFALITVDSSAIMCYHCNSEYDPRCGDPFNSYSLGVVNCSVTPRPEHITEEPTLCRKIMQKGN